MILMIQLWSVNYTLVARICKSNANDNFKRLQEVEFRSIKDAPSSLRKCLETETPLTMLKNPFHLQYSCHSHYI